MEGVFFRCYLLIFVCGTSSFQEIFFKTDKILRENDPCKLSTTGSPGRCVKILSCWKWREILHSGVSFRDVSCGSASAGLICCPNKQGVRTGARIYDISQPDSAPEGCGTYWRDYGMTNLLNFYELNNTVLELEAKGFKITDIIVYGDQIQDFRLSNDTFSVNYREIPDMDLRFFTVGGQPARIVVARYMALLGEKSGSKIEWFCDGVLLNWQWVLTAAHCFVKTPNVVRLGEYNLDTIEPTSEEAPIDYEVKRIVFYPDYKYPATNHDLALVQLSKPTFISRPDINPVCLPWGAEATRTHVNQEVTLTGWGATIFGGLNSPVLQEVNVTVFDTSVCDQSYSTLWDYIQKFPIGMTSQTHLCAGDESGGKDACQGDSGGPLVYLNGNYQYTLAGIVSSGNGCGRREFPGIYVPINQPKYLDWIKRIAF